MTKRLLALATALILAVSMLNLSVFADTGSATITDTGSNTVKIEWSYTADDSSSAVTYTYSLVDKTNNKTLKSGTKVSDTSVTGIAYTASGTLALTVDVYVDGTWTKTLTADNLKVSYTASSTKNGITVTQSGDSAAVVTWTDTNYSSYTVEYKTSSSGTATSLGVVSSGATIPVAYSSLYSVTVKGWSLTGGAGVSTTIGTWTYSGSGSGSSTGYASGLYVQAGSSSASAGTTTYTLTWNGSSSYSYYYIRYVDSTSSSGTGYTTTSATSLSLKLITGHSYTIYVYGYTSSGTSTSIGYAYIVSGTTGTINGLSGSSDASGISIVSNGITSNGTYSYTLSWGAYTGATYYAVYAGSTRLYYGTATKFTYQFFYPATSYSIYVYAYDANGNSLATVGNTTIVGGTTGSSTSTTTYTTTSGTRCTVYSYASYKTISWTAYSGADTYLVYYVVGTNTAGTTLTTSATSATIPVANTYAVTIYVIPMDSTGSALVTGAWASATVAATTTASSSSSTTNTTTATSTETDGVYISSQTTLGTTLTWDKVSGAKAYYVMYGGVNSTGSSSQTVTTNSVTIPFGKNASFIAYVYAIPSSGGLTNVGKITYISGTGTGSDSSSSSSSDSDASVYPTSFKATSGNSGKITLSWTAADDATSYTVYWKRSSNSTWKKAGTVKKTAVTISGLNDGTSYDFYVVANTGYSSGTATITCSTKTSTVTATDPVASTATLSSLTSVTSSSSGSITVSWTAVSGATSYKVYVAEGSSSTYKCKATVTSGTSTTITGLTSGTTYKVRVVAVPYQTDLSTDLKACSYMSVTVK
ncbi:MAG: fibronectin type III domain-containing protein [Oscillospiraceae bacterium]|nr:fibronectin type III domain-containing protein [Oscillospiraceae bacterium]